MFSYYCLPHFDHFKNICTMSKPPSYFPIFMFSALFVVIRSPTRLPIRFSSYLFPPFFRTVLLMLSDQFFVVFQKQLPSYYTNTYSYLTWQSHFCRFLIQPAPAFALALAFKNVRAFNIFLQAASSSCPYWNKFYDDFYDNGWRDYREWKKSSLLWAWIYCWTLEMNYQGTDRYATPLDYLVSHGDGAEIKWTRDYEYT